MTRKKLIAALAVAALVVTAGCAGVLNEDTTQTPTTDNGTDTTDTPTTTDTPEKTLSNFNYPEGASQDGLTTDTLVSTQSDALDSASSVTITREQTQGTGDQQFTNTQTVKFANGTVLSVEENAQATTTTWYGESQSLAKVSAAQETRYYVAEGAPAPRDAFNTVTAKELLSVADFQAQEVTEVNGEPVVKYTATNIDKKTLAQVYGAESVSNASIAFYVGEDGLIHQYQSSADMSRAGRTMSASTTVSISDVGATSVSEPSWLSTASEDAVSMSASNTDSYTEITLDRGESLDSGANLYIASRTANRPANIALNESFEQGDTLYVYMQDGTPQASFTEPTGETKALEGGSYVGFFSGDQGRILAYEMTLDLSDSSE